MKNIDHVMKNKFRKRQQDDQRIQQIKKQEFINDYNTLQNLRKFTQKVLNK